jgi:hypothetical protein
VSWGDTIEALHHFVEIDSFDNAIKKPHVTAHNSKRAYNLAFKLKSEIPTQTLYYLTKVFGSKSTKAKVNELKDYVKQCQKIGEEFEYFMNNEWIFDNFSSFKLQKYL